MLHKFLLGLNALVNPGDGSSSKNFIPYEVKRFNCLMLCIWKSAIGHITRGTRRSKIAGGGTQWYIFMLTDY